MVPYIKVLDQAAVDIDKTTKDCYDRLIKLIEGGMGPRGALNQIYLSFSEGYLPEIALILSKAFTSILEKPFTVNEVYNYKVGNIPLSAKLYADAKEVSKQVEAIIQTHANGIQNLKDLALQMYEGYGFNSTEVLVGGKTLPKYLKQVYGPFADQIDADIAKIIARDLKTAPLRAAYLQVIAKAEAGAAKKVLDKAIYSAIQEKLRYYADRVAQTELARAYSRKQASKLKQREDIQYVQVRAAGNHKPDICDMFLKVDRYGKGEGIYPVNEAPVAPYHPYCRCRVVALVNLTSDSIPEADKEAERKYLQSLSDEELAGILPKGTRDAVAKGADLREYLNSKSKDEYAIPLINDL